MQRTGRTRAKHAGSRADGNAARPARARAAARATELQGALDCLRRIVQALRQSSRESERRLGISGAQLFVLHTLDERPAESLNDLAQRMFTHQSTLSVVVRRLVRAKLVRIARATDDRRRLLIELTPAGRALLRRAPKLAQLSLVAALDQLRTSQLRDLARLLGRVVHAMGADADSPALLFESPPRARKA